jgi:hypothetical protein
MDDGNFRQWRSFFTLTFQKFGLVSLVDGNVAAATMIDDPEWLQVDSCIVQWLYSTVSKDIWSDVYRPQNSAYTAWSAITGQFLDNSLQRTVYTQQEFHNLYQGDMTVGEYCGRLKRLADTLYDCHRIHTTRPMGTRPLNGIQRDDLLKARHALSIHRRTWIRKLGKRKT